MSTITHIAFDLGGVVLTIDKQQAVRRFIEIGVDNAEQYLDDYEQQGIFGQLEAGEISDEEFRLQLGQLAAREFTHRQCAYAWQGYAIDLPERNLKTITQLRRQGLRVCLLSNTNPFMMEWARSSRFDGLGNPIDHYFDALYLSYELHLTKPDPKIFAHVLQQEHVEPQHLLFVDDGPQNVAAAAALGIRTFQPVNGHDWTQQIFNQL